MNNFQVLSALLSRIWHQIPFSLPSLNSGQLPFHRHYCFPSSDNFLLDSLPLFIPQMQEGPWPPSYLLKILQRGSWSPFNCIWYTANSSPHHSPGSFMLPIHLHLSISRPLKPNMATRELILESKRTEPWKM